jgi:hypothetical protein
MTGMNCRQSIQAWQAGIASSYYSHRRQALQESIAKHLLQAL